MTTERLEEFAVLAKILNFSKASGKLFISQSVLSRHIRELESELGAKLFQRDTHGVQLTEEGKYLLKWVEPLLKKTERAVLALNDSRTGSEGTVNVLCEEQTLDRHMVTFLRTFQENYPGIVLKLSPRAGFLRKEQIYSGDVILTLCDYTQTLRRDAEGSLLGFQEPLLAIPPYHHFGDLQIFRLEELRGETLIVPFMDELSSPYARNAMIANRKCRSELGRVGAETVYEALLMVELSGGVMLIPHHLKHRIYPHTRTIPVIDPECVFPIYAYRNKTSESPAAELFYEKMLEYFRSE